VTFSRFHTAVKNRTLRLYLIYLLVYNLLEASIAGKLNIIGLVVKPRTSIKFSNANDVFALYGLYYTKD